MKENEVLLVPVERALLNIRSIDFDNTIIDFQDALTFDPTLGFNGLKDESFNLFFILIVTWNDMYPQWAVFFRQANSEDLVTCLFIHLEIINSWSTGRRRRPRASVREIDRLESEEKDEWRGSSGRCLTHVKILSRIRFHPQRSS